MHDCTTNALRMLERAASQAAGGVASDGFIRPLLDVAGLDTDRDGLAKWMDVTDLSNSWLSVFGRVHTDHELMRLQAEHDLVCSIKRDGAVRWGGRIGAILSETAVRRGQVNESSGVVNRIRQSLLQFEQLKQEGS